MRTVRSSTTLVAIAAAGLLIASCAPEGSGSTPADGAAPTGTGGSGAGPSGSGGGPAPGGTGGAMISGSGGAATGTGGAAGGRDGGTAGEPGGTDAGTGGSGSIDAGAGRGGGGTGGGAGGGAGRSGAGTGGRAAGGSGGASGTGGITGGTGGGAPGGMGPPLDCGPIGLVLENAGPPRNRVNYVILGDGYTASTLATTYVEHLNKAMAVRFSDPVGQPYLRYRKFVNICALKIVSENNGVAGGMPTAAGPTALGCGENNPGQNTRLARCNTQAAMAAQVANLPPSFEVDWHSIVLNNAEWWNTGAAWMLWSGGHMNGAPIALHEGGHGFHQFDDEYSSSGGTPNCTTESARVNTTVDPTMTAGKWDMWLGYNQVGATGMQGAILGARYCTTGQYRPSQNSMMKGSTGGNPNTSFNSVSREKMIMDIWRMVEPIDSTEPAAGAVNNPAMLKVNVIDAAVINVDWTVDGVTMMNAGTTFNAATLASGTHTVSAKAYDNAGMDLVRYRNGGTTYGRQNWARSMQTVIWTVTKP